MGWALHSRHRSGELLGLPRVPSGDVPQQWVECRAVGWLPALSQPKRLSTQTDGDLGRSWATSGAGAWSALGVRTGTALTPSYTPVVAMGPNSTSPLRYKDGYYNYDWNFTDLATSLSRSVAATLFMLLLRFSVVCLHFFLKWTLPWVALELTC